MIISDICYSKHLRLDWNYTLYLPDSWYDGADYPVLYLLHGIGGFHKEYLVEYQIESLIAKAKQSSGWADLIIAMPNDFNSYYINGPTLAMEDAIMQDFIKYIEQRYTSGHRLKEQRMIAGYGAGGYGALRYAMHYPYHFRKAYLIAPSIWLESPPLLSLVRSRLHLFMDHANRFCADVWQSHHPSTQIHAYQSAQSPVDFYLIGFLGDEIISRESLEQSAAFFAKVADLQVEYIPSSRHKDKRAVMQAISLMLGDLTKLLMHQDKGAKGD